MNLKLSPAQLVYMDRIAMLAGVLKMLSDNAGLVGEEHDYERFTGLLVSTIDDLLIHKEVYLNADAGSDIRKN